MHLEDFQDKYHKLERVCEKECEVHDVIGAVDINSKLNKKEMKIIMNNIDTLSKNQHDIKNMIDTMNNTVKYNNYIFDINSKIISEYIISHKILYFYGLLDENIKSQLDSRK